MTDHTTTDRTWVIVHTEPPHLVVLDPGQQLSTAATVDTYTDRDSAVTALADLAPDVEAPDDPPLPAEPPAPALTALTALVERLGPEAVTRSAVLGAHLAGHAEPLWDAVAAMSPDNDARPALDIVLTSALTAALADLPTPPQETPT